MSNANWVNVTADQLADFFAVQADGWVRIDQPGTDEITWSKSITFEGLPTIVRVYSGILKATGQSRPAGQDAIRVTLGRLDPQTGFVRIFKTLETVRRTATWRQNLSLRLRSIPSFELPRETVQPKLTERDLLEGRTTPVAVVANPPCPKCGAPTTNPKMGRKGAFHGCSRFPACKGLVDA